MIGELACIGGPDEVDGICGDPVRVSCSKAEDAGAGENSALTVPARSVGRRLVGATVPDGTSDSLRSSKPSLKSS